MRQLGSQLPVSVYCLFETVTHEALQLWEQLRHNMEILTPFLSSTGK